MSNIRCSSFQDSSNSRRKDLERVRTNTQVSDMRIWHVDTSARLSAKAAHEMQTFLHELRKLKKCQRTLDTNEARQLDAKYIRDCYDKFMYENEIMVTSRDNNICIGDPIRLFAQGKYAGVPVLAGNTEDEFPFMIDAQNEEELEKKASAWFCKKAEEFLAIPQVHEKTKDGYAPVSGIELMTKAAFLLNEKSVKPANCYYYRFAPDIPGEDHPGTFHSVDLWFFFETLAKCWRPFVGRHYDLARQMCNYWANFIKCGDPNGTDDDGKVLPKWNPYRENDRAEMVFTTQGAKAGNEKNSKLMEFLLSDRIERMK